MPLTLEQEREAWRQLARQLNMTFSQGYQGLADSPGLLRMGGWLPSVADDGEKLRKLIQDPMWRRMMDEAIPGSISGEHRGFAVHAFPLLQRERGMLRGTIRSVLLFTRPLELGLHIKAAGGLAARFSTGAIKIPGADKGILVKSHHREAVLELLSPPKTLKCLNGFFRAFSKGEIRDQGIMACIEPGIPAPDRLNGVLDQLAELAPVFRQYPSA